jgi:hypothetical protein
MIVLEKVNVRYGLLKRLDAFSITAMVKNLNGSNPEIFYSLLFVVWTEFFDFKARVIQPDFSHSLKNIASRYRKIIVSFLCGNVCQRVRNIRFIVGVKA